MKKDMPKHYELLSRQYPEYMEALAQLGEQVQTMGPLDARTRHLVQLGAAAASRSEGAVHSHARRALEAGATKEEIHHALLILTSTIGFPSVSAAISWIQDLDAAAAEE